MAGPMTGRRMKVRIWGARGSLPVSGAAFRTFGGNTICIEVRCGNRSLIFDAGSGLRDAGQALWAEGRRNIDIFFSHAHYDHLIGLPFFTPLFRGDARVRFWSGLQGEGFSAGLPTADMLRGFMRQPFFPVGPEVFCARIATHDFRTGDRLAPHPGIVIHTAPLSHPGGATGYRIEHGGKSVAMVFDTEHRPGELDQTVIDLIRDVDLFLYDTTFTDEEFPARQKYGHSTWQQAVRLAQASGARRVGFLHHATYRTDDDLYAIEAQAQARFPGAFCARDLQEITL